MNALQSLDPATQPRQKEASFLVLAPGTSGGLLGNKEIQMTQVHRFREMTPSVDDRNSRYDIAVTRAGPTEKLRRLKSTKFSPEGREGRIARSLAALRQPITIHLKPEEWSWIADELDIEDQY